jgi:hypothetical protein
MGIKPHEYGCWGERGNVFTLHDIERGTESYKAAPRSAPRPLKSGLAAKASRFALGLLFGLGLTLSLVTFIAAAVSLPLGAITVLILITQAAFAITLAYKLYKLIKEEPTSCSCLI